MKLERNWQGVASLVLLAFSLTKLPFTEIAISTAYLPRTNESIIATIFIGKTRHNKD